MAKATGAKPTEGGLAPDAHAAEPAGRSVHAVGDLAGEAMQALLADLESPTIVEEPERPPKLAVAKS